MAMMAPLKMVCLPQSHSTSLTIQRLTCLIGGHVGNSQSNLDDVGHGQGGSSEDQGLNQTSISNPLAASPSTFMSTSDGRTCLFLLYLCYFPILSR